MGNQDNIKHVMRTALVGVKPANQVILKGYLRVLLRLEADLEWVSASHPQVDLFMINEEFRHSPNIVKLIQSQTNKPVLYISKNDNHTGDGLSGNALTLPLKKLNLLNDWLFHEVTILKSQSENYERRESANKSIDNKPKELPQDTISQQKIIKPHKITPKKADHFFSSHSHSHPDNSRDTGKRQQQEQLQTDSSINSENKYELLIDTMYRLKKGVDGAYKLKIEDTVIAIIEPSRARLWKDENSQTIIEQNSLMAWHLEAINITLPDAARAIDLKQWLWEVSWNKKSELLPLIEKNRTYHLEHWVKPNEQQNKRDVLSIMTAIESVASSVNQASEIANTTVEDGKRIIAGLLFAGYLQPDNYENIKPTFGDCSSNQTSSIIPTAPKMKTSPLESVLSKRAAGVAPINQPTSTIPANIISPSSATQMTKIQPKKEVVPEKLGFLGRLRRKLGL